jgi:predicted HTH domain antitoxin
MSSTLTYFEVEVMVRGIPYEYYSRFGKRIGHDIVKMFHFERRTPEQAVEAGKRYGEVLTCRKADREKILGSVDGMSIDPIPTIYDNGNPYKNAMAMDDMIWKKRNIRRANLDKDKKDLDI